MPQQVLWTLPSSTSPGTANCATATCGLFALDSHNETPEDRVVTTISGTDLERQVSALSEDARTLLVLDTCMSGQALQPDDYTVSLDDVPRLQFTRPNMAVLVACGAHQASRESEHWGGGVFTSAFIEALRNGDDDGDGPLTVDEIRTYCKRRLPGLTGGGAPQMPEGVDRITVPILSAGSAAPRAGAAPGAR